VLLSSLALVLVSELAGATFASRDATTLLLRAPAALAVDAGCVAALLLSLWGATNRLGFALFTTSGALLFLTVLHIRKVQLLALPLLPWDLAHFRHVAALLPTMAFDGVSIAVLAGLGTALTIGLLLLRGAPRQPLPGWARGVALLALAPVLAFPLVRHDPRVARRLDLAGVTWTPWDQHQTYRQNGLPLLLLMNADALKVERPAGYSREAVLAAMASDEAPGLVSDVRPDVVLFMAESLWDPTKLGVPMSPDPLRFLRSLEGRFPSGRLVSPVFGGGTANTEFELLSGLSNAFLPAGATPYQHFVNAPVETLASHLRASGWRTAAVHPFHRWYWSRDAVYPLLGVESFEGIEEFEGARRHGPWVSDDALVDRVLATLPRDGAPLFLFAVSMATHGTYLYAREEREAITVVGGLEQWTHHEVVNYANAVAKADRALERLVAELATRPRPTLLVVFGDHLPILGPDHAAYRQAGFLRDEDSSEQRERMASVPVWTWSNRPLPAMTIDDGMFAVPVRVLEAMGRPRAGMFGFLERVSREVVALRRDLVRLRNGRTFASIGEALRDPQIGPLLESYRLLCYDRLLGERWSSMAPRADPLNASLEP
jgi:phosphoglycerol transferase MdoB-like AlkP superfamily enzyme